MIYDHDTSAGAQTDTRETSGVTRLALRSWQGVVRFGVSLLVTQRRWWLGAAVAAAVVLFAASSHLSGPRAAARRGSPSSGREAQVMRSPLVEDVFYLTGDLKAARSLEVRVPQGATWQVQIKWLAEDGAELKEGDPIVEFDSSSAKQAIEEKRMAVTQAEIALDSRQRSRVAERAKKQAALELAEVEEQKARIEAEVPDSLRPRREWHQKQSDLHDRQAALDKARRDLKTFEMTSKAEVENLRIALDKARRDLATSQEASQALAVRAPRPGILVVAQHWQSWAEDRKLQAGDTLYPSTLVASIPDLSEMVVEALLPEVDEGRIAPGQPARCILDTYPDRVFHGRVTIITPVAEQARERSGFRTRVALTSTDAELMRPGMSVRIEVVRASWKDALVVPRAAIEWRQGHAFVAHARDDAKHEVRLRGCTPSQCVVESGLTEGEHVVL